MCSARVGRSWVVVNDRRAVAVVGIGHDYIWAPHDTDAKVMALKGVPAGHVTPNLM